MHRFSQLVSCTWTLYYYDAVFKTTHLILFSSSMFPPPTYLCPRPHKPPLSNVQLPCCERIPRRQPQVGFALQSNAKPLPLAEFSLLLGLLLCQNQTITHKRVNNEVSISSQIDISSIRAAAWHWPRQTSAQLGHQRRCQPRRLFSSLVLTVW